MLRPEYLSRKLTSPLPTKDGGTLRTIREACEYMAAIGKERARRLHWQRVREVMLQEADEAAVTWRVQLAVLSVAGRKNSSKPKPKGHPSRSRTPAGRSPTVSRGGASPRGSRKQAFLAQILAVFAAMMQNDNE